VLQAISILWILHARLLGGTRLRIIRGIKPGINVKEMGSAGGHSMHYLRFMRLLIGSDIVSKIFSALQFNLGLIR
jgi:hypothetical protein